MTFYVGQKVVCTQRIGLPYEGPERCPQKGALYHVSSVGRGVNVPTATFISLREISGRRADGTPLRFNSEAFRPAEKGEPVDA